MNNNFYDVIVAKQYQSNQNGVPEQKTAWNKIGKAWLSKSGTSLSFELFMYPGQRYVVQLQNNKQESDRE